MSRATTYALAAAAVGALALLVLRRGDEPDQEPAELEPEGADMPTVFHRERANGVDRRLLSFLDWWQNFGPFPITVAPDGGVRTNAQQAALYAKGRTLPGLIVTNAATAENTAHGHGGALDLYPVAPTVDGKRVAALLEDWTLFEQLGHLAKAHGLRWGGDFTSPRDGPHIEVPDWRLLPIAGGYV